MDPIAIIGVGCRFPSAKNPESFWELLHTGGDAITEVPPERWNIDTLYEPEPATPGKMYTRWAGLLEKVDHFDPSFFRISPYEAEYMDPQHRLLLEVAWEALENAGLAPNNLSGSQTGVFIGISSSDYDRLGCYRSLYNFSHISGYSGTGTSLSVAANRISYLLNLRGPSMAIDTACSASLVAVHYACQSLQTGESNLCLVGGVNLIFSPVPMIACSQARMMAADGRCKTFDASADGYVRGEGCGVVVLKRLADALQDGDHVLAVIRGSAVNQDGLTNGLTAPNGPSQQAVIRQALKNTGVEPEQISYVEAHGTGTSLGDPIEVRSLKAVLMPNRQPDQTCWLGSVKTNIGHLEAAAGIASLIKVVLSLQHQEIPPNLHFKQLNPYISLAGTTFSIPTECQSWTSGKGRRFAGISAFGFGGTNCHVIVEEAPVNTIVTSNIERSLHLLTLSAKSEQALRELVQSYTDFLASHPQASLADICFTANTGRSHFNYRLAILTSDKQELAEKLAKISAGKEASTVFSAKVFSKSKSSKIAFLFTGQGSQYVNMGRQLYETQPVFRRTLDQCEQILQSYLEKSILDVLYPEDTQELNSSVIDETAYTQPALFALEYALAQLWKSWGIEPDVVMGHSVGEYVAATVAGVFSLEDGLKLIANRGRLMQALPLGGKMVAVFASELQVREVIKPLGEEVSIAAINAPVSIVISGDGDAIRTICDRLESDGIKTKKLQVSHAFHSPLMEPMLGSFEAVASEITYNKPRIPIISNLTGKQAKEDISTPQYWVNHVRQPVKFAAGMETLDRQGYEIFLEIGPSPILLGMGRQCLLETKKVWLPSLRPGKNDWLQMLESLGQLYVQGAQVNWSGMSQYYTHQKVVLPTYPWQRKRYWLTDIQHPKNTMSEVSNLEKKVAPVNLETPPDAQPNDLKVVQESTSDFVSITKHNQNFDQPKIRLSNLDSVSVPKASSLEQIPKRQLVQFKFKSVDSEPLKLAPQGVVSQKIISVLENDVHKTKTQTVHVNITQLKETLKQQLASILYVEISEIKEDQNFLELGLDSIVGVEWINTINHTYGLEIKASKLYDVPTLLELAEYIAEEIYTKNEKFSTPVNDDYGKEPSDINHSSVNSQENYRKSLRSILNQVANNELTIQAANQMIQELKQKG